MSPSTPNVSRRNRPPVGPVVYIDDGDVLRARVRFIGLLAVPVACALTIWGVWPGKDTGGDPMPSADQVTESGGDPLVAVAAERYQLRDASWQITPDAQAEEIDTPSLSWDPGAEQSAAIRERFKNVDIVIQDR